jgi:hypothetical protein
VRSPALIVVFLAACGHGSGASDDAGIGSDAAVDLAQGSTPSGDLVVNEVSPKSSDGPDWIEILNRGAAPIDLCAVFLTDLADRLDHFTDLGGVLPPDPCAPRMLGPGERLVVVADDAIGLDHAPFHLSAADEVHLLAIDGIELDGLLYLYPDAPAGFALARVPDGEGRFFLRPATQGTANPEDAP